MEGFLRRLRDYNLMNLVLPWMFDVLSTTQTVLRPTFLPIRMCVTFRHIKERLAHGRTTARALATRVVNRKAGYRSHALIIKQIQYNFTALNMGYAYMADCANGRAPCEDLIRIDPNESSHASY
jgi:hypothetical protein